MTRSESTSRNVDEPDDSDSIGDGGPLATHRAQTSTLPTTFWLEERLWLLVAVSAASLVVAAYLLTHTHPAYEGGFYLEAVEAILRDGWGLPERIPGYTADGVPFAYPPLMFYAVAGLVAVTGIDPVALELYLPGLTTVACLLPFWLVARELLPSRRQAGLATVLYAVTPAVLQWHVSAGGIVRAPAMFLTLAGVYSGIRLFGNGGRRWLLASTVLFGLVVLSHPVYAAFFGLSFLVLYAARDRSGRGLLQGAVVAVGGVAIASPWWLTVIARHGPDVFLGVHGTRSRIGGGADRVAEQFAHPIAAMDPITPFYVAAFAGGVYAATRRRFLLPIWMITASFVLGEDRFTFVAGSMLAAMVLVESALPRVEAELRESERPRGFGGASDWVEHGQAAVVGVLAILVLGSVAVGGAYAGSALQTAHVQSSTMPQTVDADDRTAMAWVAENTDPDAEFAVVGDAAEWFPHYADRRILLSPWGTEWTSPAAFRLHVARYQSLSTCSSTHCLWRVLRDVPGEAEYVYVPRGRYTVRGKEYGPPRHLLESLDDSPRFERRYENDGVAVFRVDRQGRRSSARQGHAIRRAPAARSR